MPLYEYLCEACGERSEILQKMSDPPATHCPKCGGTVKKLHSAPAIQFKGSGFYKTDYASKSSAAPSSETKTESKTETKTETTAAKSESSSAPSTTATKSDT